MSVIGEVLQGTYRLEREIGQGGMGTVYEASHTRLDRRFAVKVLVREAAADEAALLRFQREARVTSSLGHPHIIEVIDFNATEDGRPYLVMELLEGESLADRLERRGSLSLEEVVSIARQATSALHAAHQRDVVHRDLKPENVFLCKRGSRDDYVKLLDFGISKVLNAKTAVTRAQALVGSPSYMSPEQAEERAAEVDARTDIYGMATLIFEMLTGDVPFTAKTIPSLLYKIVHQAPPRVRSIRPGLPPGLDVVIDQALSKDPNARQHSMAELWTAIDDAVVEITAEPTQISHTAWPNTSSTPSSEQTLVPVRTDVDSSGAEVLDLIDQPGGAAAMLTGPQPTYGASQGPLDTTGPRLPAYEPKATGPQRPQQRREAEPVAPAAAAIDHAPTQPVAMRRAPERPISPTSLRAVTASGVSAGPMLLGDAVPRAMDRAKRTTLSSSVGELGEDPPQSRSGARIAVVALVFLAAVGGGVLVYRLVAAPSDGGGDVLAGAGSASARGSGTRVGSPDASGKSSGSARMRGIGTSRGDDGSASGSAAGSARARRSGSGSGGGSASVAAQAGTGTAGGSGAGSAAATSNGSGAGSGSANASSGSGVGSTAGTSSGSGSARKPVVRRRRPGSLRIGSLHNNRPVWANIYLDGKLVGQTPLVIGKLRAGRHVVELRRLGQHLARRVVYIHSGRRSRAIFKLKSL